MNKIGILTVGILAMLVGSSAVIPEASAGEIVFGPSHPCAGDLDHECTHSYSGNNTEICAVWVAGVCA